VYISGGILSAEFARRSEDTTRRNPRRAWVLAVIIPLVLMYGLYWLAVQRPVNGARHFMRDFQKLEIGTATLEDVKKIADANRGTAISEGGQSIAIGGDNCRYGFSFYNTGLHRSGLAPEKGLIAFLTVDENRLTAREVDLVCLDRVAFPQVFVRERQRSSPNYKLVRYFGPPYLGIEMTPSAPLEQREAAFEVNVDFLRTFGRCAEPHDRIPAIPAGVQLEG
jgi:hypothetical protein